MPPKPLRILQLINSLDPGEGGTVECVRQVSRSIIQQGHEVEVAVCGDTFDDPWIRGFPLKVFPLGPGVGRYAYSARLRGWLAANGRGYDAWIVNGLWQFHGLAASRAATALRIPYFVYPQGMLDPWDRRAHPMKYLKKVLYWLLVERATLLRANALLFASDEEARLARRFFPASGWKTEVIGNGVADPPGVSAEQVRAFRDRLGIPERNRTWLFLSRIHPKKGLEDLLRAFAALGPKMLCVDLVVVGDGDPDYVAGLKKLAADLRIAANVRWAGPLYGDAKWVAFSAAELFVLPSHQENFGIAIAEALASATPVCTTTAVNISGVLSEYGAGLVCADEPMALRSSLERWLEMPALEMEAFGRNARRCFEEKFQVGVASRCLLGVVEAAVAATRPDMETAT